MLCGGVNRIIRICGEEEEGIKAREELSVCLSVCPSLHPQVDCNDNSAVFAHCFPSALLPLFLDGLPFCEFHPLHALGSNRYKGSQSRR